jgi:hypothetical protein
VLRVGPASVALEGRVDPGRWSLDAAHQRFVAPAARPQLTLRVRRGPLGPPRGALAFRLGGMAGFYRDGEAWTIRLGGDDDSAPADRLVGLAPSGEAGALVLDMDRSPALADTYPLEHPLEELLFRHLLAERRALLVHACGVAWRGQGYLFVGSSGAGKSTMARLWAASGATVLNDDRVVLEGSPDAIRIHPTPWFGDHPDVGEGPVPLAAVHLLRQAPEVAFQPLRPARAAALLFAKSFPPVWDPARIAGTLETLDLVCRRMPCGWLSAPPDQRAVAWVRAHH